jgi:predicted RNase H-like nuclease (RuvC/YqgF family)
LLRNRNLELLNEQAALRVHELGEALAAAEEEAARLRREVRGAKVRGEAKPAEVVELIEAKRRIRDLEAEAESSRRKVADLRHALDKALRVSEKVRFGDSVSFFIFD